MNDDVVPTQSCMAPANFGVDLDGRAVLFDASTIQALPVTLADYSLLRTSLFGKAVSRHVFGDEEMAVRLSAPSMNALAEVRQEVFGSANFGDCKSRVCLCCGSSVLMG